MSDPDGKCVPAGGDGAFSASRLNFKGPAEMRKRGGADHSVFAEMSRPILRFASYAR